MTPLPARGPTDLAHLSAADWDLHLADALQEPQRLAVEAHLDSCGSCRAELEARDPSLLFRRLRTAEVPAGTWTGFWQELQPRLGRQDVALPQPSARRTTVALSRTSSARPWLLAAAAVVAVALLGALASWRWTDATTGAGGPVLAAASPCRDEAARLQLTPDECAALYGSPFSLSDPPTVILAASVDLRGL